MITYKIEHETTHVAVDVRKDGSVNVNINVGSKVPVLTLTNIIVWLRATCIAGLSK